MDQQTLVNILSEIAELEELRLKAEHTVDSNTAFIRKMAALQAEYDADAQTAESLEKDGARQARSLERDLSTVEEQLREKNDRLVGVSDRRQHQALLREIAQLEKKREELEEAAIASLESGERAGQEAAQARVEQTEIHAAGDAESQAKAQEASAMSERLENIDVDLKRLLGMLPPLEKKHVERLMEKLDRAVVPLHNGACTGCFHQLPRQEAINVGRGRSVMRCPSCRRYLVHESWK